MTRREGILLYLGGFARIGGIEGFARDFLLAIAPAHPNRELLIWGPAIQDNSLLQDIARSGARISRFFWRWGCRWNLPDYTLTPLGLLAVWRARAVIFKRPPPIRILRLLRKASRQPGPGTPFILITPYRPAEYWGKETPPPELQYFDIVTVQSDKGVEDLKDFGFRGRIEKIPLIPPKPEPVVDFPISFNAGLFRLGFLGRLEPQKNLFYLLDVYRELQKSHRDMQYELHLFGAGSELEELKQKCADLKLENVMFQGSVERSKVTLSIDSCHMFLNTSITEGQCLAALEVLNRGRPFIATPVGALPEVLEENELGRLAPLNDPAAFASIVSEMALRIRGGHITPESVQSAFRRKFDYSTIVQRYLDLLAG